MGYIDQNLAEGERVLRRGNVHWFIFALPAFLFITGIVFLSQGNPGARVFGSILAISGFIIGIGRILFYLTTELALTNQRIIAKSGFISRKSVEIPHSMIESIRLDQGVFGRLMGFGTVTVGGTGGAIAPIPYIVDPIVFRNLTQGVTG